MGIRALKNQDKNDSIKGDDGFSETEVMARIKEVQRHGFGRIEIEIKDGIIRQVGEYKTFRKARS